MPGSYFVIELSARWLVALIVALALALIMAFAFGYGAAWSVMGERVGERPATILATATPTAAAVIDEVVLLTATPAPRATALPTATPTPRPTAAPEPTALPEPTAVPTTAATGFYVQVLATSERSALEPSRKKLEELGFDRTHQSVVPGSGDAPHRLRIGPFPDRASADRVQVRMKAAGFADAWVIAP